VVFIVLKHVYDRLPKSPTEVFI